MFQWNDVEAVTIDGATVKMYREPLEYTETQSVKIEPMELDHYAYKYLGSEINMYQILEVNFIEYIEQRGNMKRMTRMSIPIKIRQEQF